MSTVLYILLVSKIHSRLGELLDNASTRGFQVKLICDRESKLLNVEKESNILKNLEVYVPDKKKLKGSDRFNRFLLRWKNFSEIAHQPFDYYIFIRSDLFIDLDEFNSEILKKPVSLLKNFKILDPKTPILRKYFLQDHIFDGLIAGQSSFFKNAYYLIKKNMKKEVDRKKNDNFLLSKLLLNMPSVNYERKSPEYYLNKALFDFGRDKVHFWRSLSASWECYKPMGLLDTIFRYPYFNTKT